MSLFRRRNRAHKATAHSTIDPFWAWWASACAEVTEAVEAGRTERVEELIGPQVAAVHPDLEWEFGAGQAAKHLFVVSSGGRPELRPLAERWRRAGPGDDDAWEFRPSRQADPNAFLSGHVMSAGGVEVNIAGVLARADVDDHRCRLDVSVYHPRFFEMTEHARAHLAFLVLDWAIGEDDVERWLGAVEAVTVEPLDPISVSMLASVVEQAAERWAGDRWAVMEGWHGQHRLMARIRHPLHRVDHPLFDQHVGVRLPYADMLPDGLPGEEALRDLRAFEEALVGRLGHSARLVAQETSVGERMLHLYGDSTASVVPLIEAMLGAYQGGTASVSGHDDPAWRLLEHLRP
jgi:hypothetical protein